MRQYMPWITLTICAQVMPLLLRHRSESSLEVVATSAAQLNLQIMVSMYEESEKVVIGTGRLAIYRPQMRGCRRPRLKKYRTIAICGVWTGKDDLYTMGDDIT